MQRDPAQMREAYAATGLAEADLAADPVTQFARWFDEAVAAGLPEPNAMVLATCGPDGPAARTVLLKGYDERGFTFFTNTASDKARDLAADPRAALVFPWHALHRQVRVVGAVEVLPRAAAEAYFASRPRGSQLGAWASPQSTVVPDRADLDRRYADAAARFPEGTAVPLPQRWGGYRVVPRAVELWAGRDARMHDRLRYRRGGTGSPAWVVERLAP